MDMLLIGIVAGLLVGALLAWSWARGEAARSGAALTAELAGARAERDGLRERVVDLEASLGEDTQTAAALTPLRSTLQRVQAQVEMLERDRVDQFAAVREALTRVESSTAQVASEAGSLASSLRVSSVRGTWGETQLRRVLESSGMLARCDFDEQADGTTSEGVGARPDVVVRLPGGKHLVVDAKAPMSDWLAAQGTGVDDAERERLLGRHVAALRSHVRSLAAKEYWTAFDPSPEMVVCFVPSEATLSSALAHQPGLHEEAMRSRVVLASPGTLLALLRTVAYTWQQDALTRSAADLLTLGRELHQRLSTLGERTTTMGRRLTRAVEAYNAMVGTLESRVLVSARRMSELGVAHDELPAIEPLDIAPRTLSAPELVQAELDEVAAPYARPEITPQGRPAGAARDSDVG